MDNLGGDRKLEKVAFHTRGILKAFFFLSPLLSFCRGGGEGKGWLEKKKINENKGCKRFDRIFIGLFFFLFWVGGQSVDEAF